MVKLPVNTSKCHQTGGKFLIKTLPVVNGNFPAGIFTSSQLHERTTLLFIIKTKFIWGGKISGPVSMTTTSPALGVGSSRFPGVLPFVFTVLCVFSYKQTRAPARGPTRRLIVLLVFKTPSCERSPKRPECGKTLHTVRWRLALIKGDECL